MQIAKRRVAGWGGILAGLGIWLCPAPSAAGIIRYDAQTNRLRVSDFPEEQPATLDDVLAADQAGGWNRVAYDPASDNYTVQAALWIGATNDLGTFFQIGRTNHPKETLVLHGDLVVAAPRPSPQRPDGRFRISNRLTLGDPDHPAIQPVVKIACSRLKEFAVRVLAAPAETAKTRPLGEWFMFNATLTAATPDAQHAYAAAIALLPSGANYRIANSEFSWWRGDLFAIVVVPGVEATPAPERVLQGVTFQHGGIVRWQNFNECVFRDLDTALTQGGATRCVFEGNRQNLALHANHLGAALLDCRIGPASQPMRLPRVVSKDVNYLRAVGVNRHARDLRVAANPGVLELISLPVKVVDAQGRPVPDARVWLSCPEEPDGAAVLRRLAVTGQDGLTPGAGHDQALVIAAREWRPTDNPAAPEQITYSYRVRVEAPGYAPMEIGLSGDASVPRPLVVRLKPAK